MLVLDTDHLSELDRWSSAGISLDRRLEASGDEVATTIISAEEQLRGWLVLIRGQQDPHLSIPLSSRLHGRIEYFANGLVLPWDSEAADAMLQLRTQRIRVGTLDLRTASIVLTRGALLLSRNPTGFRKVPNLRVENWLQ